jgi:phosphomannomutase/phosphoglucomutase
MVSTPEIRADCPDEVKFQLVDRVASELRKSHDVIDVDGVRVRFDQGWGLLRASNTQPALVMRFEASSRERLLEYQTEVERALEQAKAVTV